MGIFDGIDDARVSGDGNWVRPGHYFARINGVKLTKKFTGEHFLAVEMQIVQALDDDEGTGHRVGEDVTHLMKASSPSFLGNVKQFVSATLGCSPDEVGKAEADRVTSDEQPLAGIVVEFVGREITTKAGRPFTKVTYKREVPTNEINAA